ncbi:MAG: hypothetical protein CMH13_24290 [Martelella sp.]|uniref:NfrA family protein n=3 Tax=Martelella TaxID=293088 RepID=UPI000C5DEEEB|nr:hypothetical protein [Martelella sp.]MAU23624.1 hypothetical protein [Martelella sp.]
MAATNTKRPFRNAVSRLALSAAVAAIALSLAAPSVLADDQSPPPLSQSSPAYQAADAAYRAYGAGDYDKAVEEARKAVELAPDHEAYKTLLKNAETARDLENSKSAPSDSVSETSPAYEAADAAYKAYAAGQYRKAVDQARKAVELAPDNADYRTLLKNAEAAASRPSAAKASPADRQADAAYAAQRKGDLASAVDHARKAVRLAPGNLSFRLLLIDLLNGQRDTAAALAATDQAIAALGDNRELLRRRGVLEQKSGDQAAALGDFSRALELPGPADAERQLRLDLAAAAMATSDPLLAYRTLQPLGDDAGYGVWLQRGTALTAMADYAAAGSALDRAGALAGSEAERADVAAAEIRLAAAQDGKRQARAMFAEASQDGSLAPLGSADIAYLAASVGNKDIAYQSFKDAYDQGQLRGAQLIDAGYAAVRDYRNEEAVGLFKQAIDQADADVFSLSETERFNLRRQIGDVSRQWGAYASVIYGTSGISDGYLSPAASAGEVMQVGTEIYWRPPMFGYRDGRTVDLFLRQFTTLYDSLDGPVGASTMQGAAGIRIKPFSDYNFIVEGARYFKIGRDSRDDYLLRAAISGGFNTDLMPEMSSWWTGQYFGEVGRYLESNQNFADGYAQLGRSFKLGGDDGKFVLTPYLGIAADYNSTDANEFALGAGPGLKLSYWFRENKYEAPMSHIDLNVQYRARLGGDDRAQGWFASLGLTF